MGDDMMNELEISCEGLLTDKLTKSVNSSSDVIVDSKSLDGPNVRRAEKCFDIIVLSLCQQVFT